MEFILDLLTKSRTKPQDTNMTVDLDTDPTYEDTTEKGVVVVSPLNGLISDQMECRQSLKSAKKYCTHEQFFVNNILTIIEAGTPL